MSEINTQTDAWAARVAQGNWVAIADEINVYGGALLPRLLTPEETVEIREMYTNDAAFRSTVNMGRHRFGEGEYRYFDTPYPEPIERLKQAIYPRLLPIARDWYEKLGRPAPWPDTLARGWSAAPVRHGVSAIRSGERHTLALVFHDAG
jgi:hypothetical protein